MARNRLSWLFVALACAPAVFVACGGDDTTGETGGKAGSGGSTAGSGGTGGGSSGSSGSAGKAGATDGGRTDASTRIPCGETSCNPTGTQPLCDVANGRCVACLTDANCANNMQNPPRLYCSPTTGTCRSCVTDAHCTAPQVCIAGNTNSTCQLRCMSDADCATAPNNARACNLANNMCVECQNNTHCAGNTAEPVCVGTQCRQCGANSDCAATPATPVCVTTGGGGTQYTCRQCATSADCATVAGMPACVQNQCRQCANNMDCAAVPGMPACVMNTCRECSGTAPCPTGMLCQMNACRWPAEGGTEGGTPEGGGTEGGSEGGSEGGGSEAGSDGAADGAAVDATTGG